jgi:choline dehydrogenase-like flavoprotein
MSLCGWGAGVCRDNLAVIQDATVSKVLIEGNTAVGVEYLEGNSSDPEILRAKNEVILSAGAFGSSKILMVRPFTRSRKFFYRCNTRSNVLSVGVQHRQGKILEATANKRSIHVTVNGDSQSEQLSAMLATKLGRAGERKLQGRLQSNRPQQQSAAHKQNQENACLWGVFRVELSEEDSTLFWA